MKTERDRERERTRDENERKILLQIAYIEGKPKLQLHKYTKSAIVGSASAYVLGWKNHQKLVVCLRASLPPSCMESGNRIFLTEYLAQYSFIFHAISLLPSLPSFNCNIDILSVVLLYIHNSFVFFSLVVISFSYSTALFMPKELHCPRTWEKLSSNFTTCLLQRNF